MFWSFPCDLKSGRFNSDDHNDVEFTCTAIGVGDPPIL